MSRDMARNTNCRLKRPDPTTIPGTATCGGGDALAGPYLQVDLAKFFAER
jgi:hypothetical protein